MKKCLRVGIPRGLLYYRYYAEWKEFLESLDLNVISSPMTTEEILKDGIRASVTDLCFPVKAFLGHVYDLKDDVDCLFIPRYISVEHDAYMCPKMLGLPDMVKAVFSNLPPVLCPAFNIKDGKEKTIDEFTKTIAKFFSFSHKNIKEAYLSAKNKKNILFLANNITKNISNSLLNIGIVGRTYTIFDNHLSKGIVNHLNNLGVNAVYKEPTLEEIKNVMNKLPKWIYWSFGKEVVTSAYLYFNNKEIDGVINIVNAACGPDSFTGEMIKKFLKDTKKPYMTIILDEHTSDVGLQTRIEAFIDMIEKAGS